MEKTIIKPIETKEQELYTKIDKDFIEYICNNKLTRLYKIARQRVSDNEIAQDMVQNTILEICKKIGETKRIYNLDAWLCTILKYECYHFYRSKKSQECHIDEEYLNNIIADAGIFDTADKLTLIKALEKLKSVDRMIIIYKYIYGYKNVEIGRMCNLCDKTVSRRIKKSLEIIKKKIA